MVNFSQRWYRIKIYINKQTKREKWIIRRKGNFGYVAMKTVERNWGVMPIKMIFFKKLATLKLKIVFKGTVSPDISFYFRVYKFKTVLSVRLLMVFKFCLFHSSLNIQTYILKWLLWKHLLIMEILTETQNVELFLCFSKLVMNEKIISVSRWWGWKYLHCHVGLTETCQ
jgi:hypothetical protein